VLRAAVARSIVPIVVVLPLLVVGWRASEQRPVDQLSLGIYIAVAGLLIVCEYTLAYDRSWGMAIKGKLTDFIYVIVATSLEKATLFLCAAAFAVLGRQLSIFLGMDLWPSGWPFALQVVAALIVADIGAYLRHRLFHMYSPLWRFHQIHHSMTAMYWIRSAYTHPLEQFCIMLAILFPIAFMGAGNAILGVVAFVFGLSGLLQHANVDSRSSVLNYVFATPEIHRVHHTATELGNRSNYSAFFVFMDMLLGSYIKPVHSEVPVEVGLEGISDFPGDFVTHLGLPFKRDPIEVREDEGWDPGSTRASELGKH
jgi:sterol desaturase/sphingolipid hydroxylase (fatty acid hydroxylase superfamily)